MQFNVQGPDSQWVVDLSITPPQLTQGTRADAGAVVTVSDTHLADWAAGKQTLKSLYQKGDVRADGNVALVRQFERGA